jgi:hypothetical protein
MTTPQITRPIGNALIIWTTLPLLWSSFFVGIRTWAKWQQQWSYADGVFVAGYVSCSDNRSRPVILTHVL